MNTFAQGYLQIVGELLCSFCYSRPASASTVRRGFGSGLREPAPVCPGGRFICKICKRGLNGRFKGKRGFNPYGGTWKHYVLAD